MYKFYSLGALREEFLKVFFFSFLVFFSFLPSLSTYDMGIEIKRKAEASRIPKLSGIPNVYFGKQALPILIA